jgi:hypothetical protein
VSPVVENVPPGGLSRGLVGNDSTLVSKVRWNELARMGAVVGTCREPGCGGALHAVAPSEHDAQGEDGAITWYETRCTNCGKELAAPNGRILRRSSLQGEMPSGWLAQRRANDEAEAKIRRQGHP